MSEGEESRKVRKTGSPKVRMKSEVGMPNAEVKINAADHSALNTPHSEIKNKSEIENQTSEITTMEVHHHPNLHHEKKPWKEYILEGLMIFLAVFMGFIAENVREGIVEKNRAKEYMKEMVQNLQFDTLRCALNSETNVKRISMLDSFRVELKQAIGGNINSGRLYFFYVKYLSGGMGHAAFNRSAMTELRSSGSLRLIGNRKLVADMADYYDRRLPAAETYLPTKSTDELDDVSKGIFSWIYYDDLLVVAGKMNSNFRVNYDYGKLLKMTPSPKLLKTRPEDLTQLYGALCNYEAGIKNYNFFLDYVKSAGVKLMASIKHEYNLEDE